MAAAHCFLFFICVQDFDLGNILVIYPRGIRRIGRDFCDIRAGITAFHGAMAGFFPGSGGGGDIYGVFRREMMGGIAFAIDGFFLIAHCAIVAVFFESHTSGIGMG